MKANRVAEGVAGCMVSKEAGFLLNIPRQAHKLARHLPD